MKELSIDEAWDVKGPNKLSFDSLYQNMSIGVKRQTDTERLLVFCCCVCFIKLGSYNR